MNIQNKDDIDNNFIIRRYKEEMIKNMKRVYPDMDEKIIEEKVVNSIIENIDIPTVELINSYKGKKVETDLVTLSNQIDKNSPILCASGVLFKNHNSEEKAMLPKQFKRFISARDELKAKMFTYQEGTYLFGLYDLLQLLAKIDGNALYGKLGLPSSILFNHEIASSITLTGRALISIVGCQIEMFLNNNVKFEDINDVINLFDDIEEDLNNNPELPSIINELIYSDNISITQEMVYNKIYESFKDNITGWIPNVNEDTFIRNTIAHVNKEVLALLYYKNNLFEFMRLPKISKIIIDIYTTAENPYINPYKPDNDIKGYLDLLYKYIYAVVYYKKIINNSILKYTNMTRSVNIITDTDSCIACFDEWYKLLREIVSGYKMKPSASYIPYDELIKGKLNGFDQFIYPYGYNYSNATLEVRPEYETFWNYKNRDGIRFTLLNIGSFILGNIINDYVDRFVCNSNAYLTGEEKRCVMVLKNEFLMKRILITDAKKLYASVIELREGEMYNNNLDIKGLQIGKSTSNERIRKELKDRLFNLILNPSEIDYKEIIEQMDVLKYQIKESLRNGDKDFYTPKKVKSISTYANPYSTQGVKSMILWNVLKDENQSPFDLEEMNYTDIVKLTIDPIILKEKYPDKYNNLCEYLKTDKGFTKGEVNLDKVIKEIKDIAVPKNESLPIFLREFINYNTVVNDNLTKMPLEHVGIHQHDKSSVTNIINL